MTAEKLKKKVANILQTSKKGYQVTVYDSYEGGRETKPFKTRKEAEQARDKISIFFKQMFNGGEDVDEILDIIELYEVDGEWLDKWDIEYRLDDIDC